MRRFLVGLTAIAAGAAWAQEDWAALGHFAGENGALGSPSPSEERVVFMGDSITAGWSEASPGFFDGRAYIERGIAGQTTAQMLVRFRSDVVALEPAVVVILAGTNDLAGNTGPASNEMIEDNLASMTEIAAENGIRVVLSSILPADGFPWAPGVPPPSTRILAINGWLEEYAAAGDHIYVDYYTALVDEDGGMDERYTYDGVHVNEAGYAVMQELVEAAIDSALDRPRTRPGEIYFRPSDDCPRTSSRRTNPRCD